MVREVESKDIEDIVLLAESEEEDAPPRAVLEPLVANYPSLLREEHGVVVGFWVTQALGDDILLIRDFAVHRAERYHQYGRDLVSHLYNIARQQGYKTLLISLRHPRPASEDFLLRSGWGVLYEAGNTRIFSKFLLPKSST